MALRLFIAVLIILVSAPTWAEQRMADLMAIYSSNAPSQALNSFLERPLSEFETAYRKYDEKIICPNGTEKFIWNLKSDVFVPGDFLLVIYANNEGKIKTAEYRVSEDACIS